MTFAWSCIAAWSWLCFCIAWSLFIMHMHRPELLGLNLQEQLASAFLTGSQAVLLHAQHWELPARCFVIMPGNFHASSRLVLPVTCEARMVSILLLRNQRELKVSSALPKAAEVISSQGSLASCPSYWLHEVWLAEEHRIWCLGIPCLVESSVIAVLLKGTTLSFCTGPCKPYSKSCCVDHYCFNSVVSTVLNPCWGVGSALKVNPSSGVLSSGVPGWAPRRE